MCKGQQFIPARRGQAYHFRVLVVMSRVENLLSRGAASRMGLILKIDETIQDAFGEIGCLQTEPVKISLKQGAEPYALNVAIRVPIPLPDKVEAELRRLQDHGIIEKIIKPTALCAPMVPVLKKSGAVRICVDLKTLHLADDAGRAI